MSTFHSTMPYAATVPCKTLLALIQSDEPGWGPDAKAAANFRLPGFKHIIIADHMRAFAQKYGMNIVGQLDNGVDTTTFYPTWTFERSWPRRALMVRKGAPVWFSGQEYAEAAMFELGKKYRDFTAVVLGGSKPEGWPCKVEHVTTYNEHEIRRLLNSVSVLVVPSLIEGRSLVPLEAMASGVPVVSTRVGMDYVQDGEDALIVPYKDSPAIVEAVSRIFDDTAFAERLMKNGLALAEKYSWENEKQQFISIVHQETEVCGAL